MTRVAREERKILGQKELAAQFLKLELEEIEACACHHVRDIIRLGCSNCREQAISVKTTVKRHFNEPMD